MYFVVFVKRATMDRFSESGSKCFVPWQILIHCAIILRNSFIDILSEGHSYRTPTGVNSGARQVV